MHDRFKTAHHARARANANARMDMVWTLPTLKEIPTPLLHNGLALRASERLRRASEATLSWHEDALSRGNYASRCCGHCEGEGDGSRWCLAG